MKSNRKMFTLVAFIFCGLVGNTFAHAHAGHDHAHEHAEGEEENDHDHSTCGCHRMSQDETPASNVVVDEKVDSQEKKS